MARPGPALRWGIVLSMVLATIAIGAAPATAEPHNIIDLADRYDQNNNGTLDLAEIQHAISVWSSDNMVDIDDDGTTVDEIQALIQRWSHGGPPIHSDPRPELEIDFEPDRDGDGCIQLDEMQFWLLVFVDEKEKPDSAGNVTTDGIRVALDMWSSQNESSCS